EVWPVQRQTDGPHPAQPGRQPADTPRFSHPEPFRPLEKAQTHEQIQAALQNVAVSQPTDSLVELITPRRPRPGKAPHPHAATPAQETAAPATEETPAQPPQPSAADTLPATPRSSVQKADPSAAAEQTPQPALVETEIGPLPADLWHLMGEQPPPDRLYPAGQTSIFDGSADQPQNPSAGLSAAAQQAQPLRANPDGLENGQTAPANPLIQRAVNITEVAGEVSPEPAGGSSTQTGQGHGGQLSPAAIDRLVKEVYAQIKRRFSIERERLHRD
ncbi:MAG: hypothetical protein AAGU05_09565, partial [Anaerolineaceae bacterium]